MIESVTTLWEGNWLGIMKTIRIHLEDLSFVVFMASDSQIEEFHNWIRFANLNDNYAFPGTEQEVKRRDIATVELIKDEE